MVSLVVAILLWRYARCSETRRYPLSDSFFDICPELALKVIAVRGHDERNDFGQEDVIYLDLRRPMGSDPMDALITKLNNKR